MTCEYAHLLGVYALDVEDRYRSAVEQHVRCCPDCRAELDELSGVRGLLALTHDLEVRPPDTDEPIGPRDDLLDRVLAAIDAERSAARATRRRRYALAAAAAVVLAAAGAGAVVATNNAQPDAIRTAAGESSVGVDATTTLTPEVWGTRVAMALRGLEPGASCRLLVRTADGRQETIASWRVAYDDTITVEGMTSHFPDDLAELVVLDDDDRQLITVPLTSAKGTPS